MNDAELLHRSPAPQAPPLHGLGWDRSPRSHPRRRWGAELSLAPSLRRQGRSSPGPFLCSWIFFSSAGFERLFYFWPFMEVLVKRCHLSAFPEQQRIVLRSQLCRIANEGVGALREEGPCAGLGALPAPGQDGRLARSLRGSWGKVCLDPKQTRAPSAREVRAELRLGAAGGAARWLAPAPRRWLSRDFHPPSAKLTNNDWVCGLCQVFGRKRPETEKFALVHVWGVVWVCAARGFICRYKGVQLGWESHAVAGGCAWRQLLCRLGRSQDAGLLRGDCATSVPSCKTCLGPPRGLQRGHGWRADPVGTQPGTGRQGLS